MRKITLIFYLVAFAFTQLSFSQDLFFSEYIEGSSSNKALEIYNPTDAAVDLTPYVVKLATNGGDWGNTLDLTGSLESGAVYVIYNSGADAAIIAKGDVSSNVTFYNGDDAVGLFKDDVLIDAFGEQGVDPGSAWDVAGVAGATGEHTLVRKSDVTSGNTDWAASAGTTTENSEWEVYDQNDFSYLGWHITPPSDKAEITGFVFAEELKSAWIDPESAQVTSTVRWDADLAMLEPEITVSEGAQVTATTLPVVFDGTNPVEYEVTAADGVTTKLWSVMVLQAAEPVEMSIHDIQFTEDASGDSPYKGEYIKTKGVVTAVEAKAFYLQDGAGAWNGVYVYQNAEPTVTIGDSVYIKEALVDEYYNLTELKNPVIEILNSGNSIVTNEIALGDVDESYEGVYFVVKDVECSEAVNNYGEWIVKDANDNTLKLDDVMYAYTPAVGDKFESIAGVLTYSFSEYKLLPRSAEDVVVKTSIKDADFSNIGIYPNPFKNSLTVDGLSNATQISISNILGQQVMNIAVTNSRMDIDAAQLQNGVYLITIVDANNNARTERIIKQ